MEAAGGWDAVTAIFDVGANDGSDSVRLASEHPEVVFVGIEPTPSLAESLREVTVLLPNYHVVECAVGTDGGVAEFNIIPGYAGGLNSLSRPMNS